LIAGHPLDPLTPAEITAAAHACSSYAVSQDIRVLRFNTITLKEPLKADLLAYSNQPETATIPLRQAFCTLQIPGECGKVIEAVVGFLDAAADAKVESWTVREGVQPLFTPDDCFEAEAIVKADLEVRKMLKETYSIEDLDMVACDPWSVHLPPCPGRLIQTFMYQRVGHVDDNAYAHPIDFVS
jgi:primary-amine oxidase